eukprot:TRINITY_DN7027_c0_g1_i1.p1 TRINITY_DN7027_c0_g1~~TRINITY_DN7027_c0_g1_i1.p1  ORF type:complete len:210 (+),score=12.36 TRINITY_DN7027_c0_g1_i1:81-710(+)
MAALAQQAAFSVAAPRTTGARAQLGAPRLNNTASPILRPWWRSLSQSLTATAPAAPKLSARRLAVRAEAAEVAEAETEEAPVAEEAPPAAKPPHMKQLMQLLNHDAAQKIRSERNIPDFRPGDVLALRVEVPENKRRVSLLRGIVISKRNGGINTTFCIRRIMAGGGVEMGFPLYSPNIKEIKVVERRKARRAKLFYLRDKIARLSTVN